VDFYSFCHFGNYILFMGRYKLFNQQVIYKDILDRWCKGLKKERFTLRHGVLATDPPYIDIGARGAVSRVYAHIYTAIYRTANHPYTKVSDPGSPRITGSQGHRVTKATEPQNHRDAQSHRITQGYRVPSIQVAKNHGVTGSPEPHYHMVTGSLSHWVTGLLGYLSHAFISMAQVSRVSMVTGLPRLLDHMIIG
jgi:hypothetical protein